MTTATSLAHNLNQFAFKLYDRLTMGNDDSFFISPYSILVTLSMALAGARDKTADEFRKVLDVAGINDEHFNDLYREFDMHLKKLDKEVTLLMANKLFLNSEYQVKKSFADTFEKNYDSKSEHLDFSKPGNAAKAINDWVAEQTRHKICELVTPNVLSKETSLLLVNAIYYKGNWKHKFNKSETYKEDFKLVDGTSKKVDMMKLTQSMNLRNNPQGLRAMVGEFPYVGNEMVMTIILPDKGVTMNELEKQLSADLISNLLKSPATYSHEVTILLPKFKLEYKTKLSEHLKRIGIRHAFDQTKADFGNMVETPPQIHISELFHTAVVDVNEEGSEAAASTAVEMMAVAYTPPVEFKCDRPFVFLITENKTHGILFMGKYMKPE